MAMTRGWKHVAETNRTPWPVAVIGVDEVGLDVAEKVAAGCGVVAIGPVGAFGEGASDLDSVWSALDAPTSDYVPAVALVGATDSAGDIRTLIAAITSADPGLRPRIWPMFVAGSPSGLSSWEHPLTAADLSLVDVAISTLGAPTTEDTVRALVAWMRLKVPAPASVLGQLADVNGRRCQFVVLGAHAIGEAFPADRPSQSAQVGEPVDAAAVPVPAELSEAAEEAVAQSTTLQCLDASAAGLVGAVAASDQVDVAAVVQAETEFSTALGSAVEAGLARAREDLLPLICRTADAAATDGFPAAAPTAEPEPVAEPETVAQMADEQRLQGQSAGSTRPRTEIVAEWISLATKGPMGRMWHRGNISRCADELLVAVESEAAAARSDTQSQLLRWVTQQWQAQLQLALNAANDTPAHPSGLDSAAQARVRNAISECHPWTPVDPARVERSWGQGLASARKYLFGVPASARELFDEPDVMVAATLTDIPDIEEMVVLAAQYGIPGHALAPSTSDGSEQNDDLDRSQA